MAVFPAICPRVEHIFVHSHDYFLGTGKEEASEEGTTTDAKDAPDANAGDEKDGNNGAEGGSGLNPAAAAASNLFNSAISSFGFAKTAAGEEGKFGTRKLQHTASGKEYAPING